MPIINLVLFWLKLLKFNIIDRLIFKTISVCYASYYFVINLEHIFMELFIFLLSFHSFF